ncbi:uncharacterized protein LOC131854951, partial [Achroia grisella]|uniref:uncharacterized protein LOC131854951 n=1 Tax=Achroia grisella TaxID=688607 RepID=UPI0027D252D4
SKHSVYSCQQTTRCKICKKRHHSLLHPRSIVQSADNEVGSDQSANSDVVVPTTSATQDEARNVVACFSRVDTQVLLATALVKIVSKAGKNITLRSLLDQGSQASFITEAAVQLLGLKKYSSRSQISGLGSDQAGSFTSKSVVFLKIQSLHDPNFVVDVKAHVLKKLTTFLPERKVVLPVLTELSKSDLADPTYTTPNKIDLLLGAKVYGMILEEGLIRGSSQSLVAQKTKLGWILSGEIESSGNNEKECCYSIVSLHSHCNENELLRKFWELESDNSNLNRKHLTPEEQRCEELFVATTKRDSFGRYVVKLPFRDQNPTCMYGNSRDIAARRFYLLEKRLLKNPKLKMDYSNVIKDYLDLGHMELVPDDERDNKNAVYLPHHPVIREDKSTTQTRVVFDASCKDCNGVSLNDDLMVGPTLQSDLRHLIMRWRLYPICLVADITKMYRQVKVFLKIQTFSVSCGVIQIIKKMTYNIIGYSQLLLGLLPHLI